MCSPDTLTMNQGITSFSTLSVFHGVASHPSSSNNQANEAFVSIVNSRKGWKSSKSGEAVWPLELEAALFEGLEQYVPHNVTIARSLGRFPMRNRFISDYIYQKTGKRRTPKQVGSRIQQMRDTLAGKKLLKLLRPYAVEKIIANSSDVAMSCSNQTAAGHQDSNDTHNNTDSSEPGPRLKTDFINVVYIDLVPPLSPQTELETGEMSTQQTRSSMQPRHIHSIDPTVAFLSRSTISAHAVYTVRSYDTVVHTERTTLEYTGRLGDKGDVMHHADNPHLYRSALVPGYWERICNSTTPTQFTIEQEVRLDLSTASDPPLFSSLYKFRFIHNLSSSLDDRVKPPSIYDKFADATTEDQVWDISAFLGPCLDILNQDTIMDDDTFFDEYFSSTMQSPCSATDSLESQSDDLYSPPPSRPHSTVFFSSCKSLQSNNISRMPSPVLSPIPTTSTLFDFSVIDHDTLTKNGIATHFDTFYSSELVINDRMFDDKLSFNDCLS